MAHNSRWKSGVHRKGCNVLGRQQPADRCAQHTHKGRPKKNKRQSDKSHASQNLRVSIQQLATAFHSNGGGGGALNISCGPKGSTPPRSQPVAARGSKAGGCVTAQQQTHRQNHTDGRSNQPTSLACMLALTTHKTTNKQTEKKKHTHTHIGMHARTRRKPKRITRDGKKPKRPTTPKDWEPTR